MRPATEIAAFIAGFVAGEGCFTSTDSGTRYRFAVALGRVDERACLELQEFFGVGRIHLSRRRKPHHDDAVVFAVQSHRELIEVVVPFMDEHLPESYKRQQYLEWRASLLVYWEHGAKRRRPCTVDACARPRRAHGLCRQHLWEFRHE